MDYRRRLELIQDTRFPVACQRIKTSRDGRFLFATGTYPPQIKVYELGQLSMKFERHLDSQIVQFQASAAGHLLEDTWPRACIRPVE